MASQPSRHWLVHTTPKHIRAAWTRATFPFTRFLLAGAAVAVAVVCVRSTLFSPPTARNTTNAERLREAVVTWPERSADPPARHASHRSPHRDLARAATATARSSGGAHGRGEGDSREFRRPREAWRRRRPLRRPPARGAGAGWSRTRGCPRTTSRGWCSRSPPASSSAPASSSRRRGSGRPAHPASAQGLAGTLICMNHYGGQE